MPRIVVKSEMVLDTDKRTCEIQLSKENAHQVVRFLQGVLATTGLKGLDIIPKAMAERAIKEFIAKFIRQGYLSFASIGDAFKFVIQTKPEP